jgi:hypothetical protein
MALSPTRAVCVHRGWCKAVGTAHILIRELILPRFPYTGLCAGVLGQRQLVTSATAGYKGRSLPTLSRCFMHRHLGTPLALPPDTQHRHEEQCSAQDNTGPRGNIHVVA